MHSLRLEHNIHVARSTVAHLMRKIDPMGTELQKRRKLKRSWYVNHGPKYFWHVDGKIFILIYRATTWPFEAGD